MEEPVMKEFWLFSLAVAATSLAGCGTEGPSGMQGMPQAPAAQTSTAAESRGVGVVQSVDAANGKVTIAHEPIESLGWPAMTMAFSVAQPDLLADVTTGQRVDFTLRGRDMSAVITSIKAVE
jgi:Cu(I)/Ag(I) efflux system protein CusF